jgi:hypothetical protein
MLYILAKSHVLGCIFIEVSGDRVVYIGAFMVRGSLAGESVAVTFQVSF